MKNVCNSQLILNDLLSNDKCIKSNIFEHFDLIHGNSIFADSILISEK